MHRLIVLMALLGIGSCHWGWDHNHHGNHHGHSGEDWPDHDEGSKEHDHGDSSEGYHDWHGHHGGPGHHGPGHRGCRGHHQDERTPDERYFDKISRYVIKADNYVARLCENNTLEVQEVYGDQSYKLIYTVPSSHVDKISVKIKHRVIHLRAEQTNVQIPQNFSDVRILPSMLKTADAMWQYKDNQVIVDIPYNVTFGTTTAAKCANANETVKNVENVPAIMYKSALDEQPTSPSQP